MRPDRALLSIVLALWYLPAPCGAQDSGPQTARVPEIVEPTIPAEIDADTRLLVEGTNAFTLDLLRAIGETDSNIILSPASVSAAVGFAYRGAGGLTAEELRRVMHYPFEPERNLKASGALMDTMSFAATGRDLRTANAIWVQETVELAPAFVEDMARYAKAGLEQANFAANPDFERDRINAWVATATRDNITELLKPGDIKEETKAVLVNAIWFKADWVSPFAKEATRDEPFTALNGEASPQPLMSQRGNFRALEHGGVKAIQLPYKGGEVALVVFLPNKHDALPRFEASLTEKEMARWFERIDRAETRATILSLPRMKQRWHRDLAAQLIAMGAGSAFSDAADFMAMVRYPDRNSLKFSAVIHEATIEVDEVGSEASAATAVTMVQVISGRRGPPPPPPFIFRADKPFLFALRDLRTGLVLFMGRYVRPEPGDAGPVASNP